MIAIVGQATIADAASQKYLQQQGVPVVGGWAASSSYHRPATNMFVSLEGPNIPYCPLWSSDQAKTRGIASIAFIAQDFPAAIQDADCRAAAAKYLGIKQAGKRIDVSLTAVDYRPAVQEAMASGAQALYFSAGTDGQLKGIQAGEQLGFKGRHRNADRGEPDQRPRVRRAARQGERAPHLGRVLAPPRRPRLVQHRAGEVPEGHQEVRARLRE